MDISFQVVSPNGVVLVNDEKKGDEVHSIVTSEPGVYSFCFDNSFSTLAQKVVYVDLGLDTSDEDSWLKSLEGDFDGTELQMESIRVCYYFEIIVIIIINFLALHLLVVSISLYSKPGIVN